MPRGPKLDYQQAGIDLRNFLLRGPASGKDLAEHLKIDRSTLTRLIEADSTGIFVAGKARNTLYARKRLIVGVEESIVIHKVDDLGKASKRGLLTSTYPRGFYWQDEQEPKASRFFDDLPYFLEDLRPSGFLGRLVPLQHPALDVPKDINLWSIDHNLRYLTRFAWDLIGDLIIGETAFSLYLEQLTNKKNRIALVDRARIYAQFADDVMRLGDPGSSAGGEQPKFLAIKAPHIKVIVKFTAKQTNELAERHADLLVCEYLANQVLKQNNFSVPSAEILTGGERTFLELERFDRIGERGRRGVISLRSLDLEFVGRGEEWAPVAQKLFALKMISQEWLTQIEWLEIFGELIANADRHLGNIAFFVENGKLQGLTPIYDMLPMLYNAPREIAPKPFNPPTPKPSAAAIWREALPAAIEFWRQVREHDKVSPGFREIAQQNYAKLVGMRVLVDALPD